MTEFIDNWLPLLIAILTTNGFWLLITRLLDKKDAKTKLLMGLAHDRITHLCDVHIDHGYIRRDERDDLHEYLYDPYAALGGNGSAKRRMDVVDKLPPPPKQMS